MYLEHLECSYQPHPLNKTRYRSPVPQILGPVPAFARYRPSEVPVEREMSAAAQDDRIGLRQTEDYCAPRASARRFRTSRLRARWTSSCRSTAGGRQLAVRAASGTAGKMNSPEAEPRHAARTAVVDRRQLTGKMKSTALGKNNFGTALPRRTIVTLTAFSRCVILGRWKMLSTPYPL